MSKPGEEFLSYLMARNVIWGPVPFVSFDRSAVAGPQAGAAAASPLDQVMGLCCRPPV